MERSINSISLTRRDTDILKGVAIIMLIIHHCLFLGDGFDDIMVADDIPIFQSIGVFCRACVSIFVFLSGYGLAKSLVGKEKLDVLSFYRCRYVKLMMNYWIVWLLFVPLGIFIFDYPLSAKYTQNFWPELISDFFGLHYVFFNSYSYNPAWWFYSLIIMLYGLFPLIWKYRNYYSLLIPMAIFMPWILNLIPVTSKLLGELGSNLLSFIVGVTFANISPPLDKGIKNARWFVVLIFLVICVYRFFTTNVAQWDVAIIIFGVYLYKSFSSINFLNLFLAFMGKHSFNIYLFHMFIQFFYIPQIVYWSRNPIVICLTLLMICIPISMFMEWFKKMSKIDVLRQKLAYGSSTEKQFKKK